MNYKKITALVFVMLLVLATVFPTAAKFDFASEQMSVRSSDAESSSAEFVAIPANTVSGAMQLSAQNGIATIESDPSRLSSPGYVNITIKLRNTGSVYGGTSAGGNSGSSSVAHYLSAGPGSGERIPSVSLLPLRPTEAPTSAPTEAPTDAPVISSDPGPVTSSAPIPTPTYTQGYTPITTPAPTYNPGGSRFTHIYISNSYGVSFQTTDVYPGSIGVFRASMMVYENMIGKPLTFSISWYDTGTDSTYYQNLALVIQRSDTAYLRMTRTVSTASAAIGDEVEFTYTLVNTGTRRLNNVLIVDEKIGGVGAMFDAFSLGSGETKQLTYTYTMKAASVVSKPTATFTPEGSSTPLSVSISKLTLGLVTAQLTKDVTVGTPTPEGVAFTLFLTNNGSQNLSDLVVTDDTGAMLASGFSLAIGESRIIELFVKDPESVRNVVFTIKGTYDSGKEFSDNTISYPVRPYINPSLLGMKFSTEVRKQLDAENSIGLTFTLENTGKLPYTDIVLTEKELGYAIHEIDRLDANSGEITFNADIKLDSPRELVFYLTALDPSGNTHTFEAYINAEYADLEGAIPNETPAADENNTSSTLAGLNVDKQVSDKGNQLMKVWNTLKILFFIALGIVIVLGVAELLLYVNAKRRHS